MDKLEKHWIDFKQQPPKPFEKILAIRLTSIKIETPPTYFPTIMEYIPDNFERIYRPNFNDDTNGKFIKKGWYWYYEDSGAFYHLTEDFNTEDIKCWIPLPKNILIEGIDEPSSRISF